MKKLIILSLFAVVTIGCYEQNPSNEEQSFIVVRTNGDTLNIKALKWHWDGSKNVVFKSYKGIQYVSEVKDVIIKE